MKRSIKIVTAALLLFAVSLIRYDLRLAAGYRNGDYTNPLYNYAKLDYKDFDRIELRSSNAVTLTVVQGNFKVLANPQAYEFLVVRQEGRKLIISARFEDHWLGVNTSPVLYVSCPSLLGFQADATYSLRSDSITDPVAASINWMPTKIAGFTEDSLAIREDHAANVVLNGNSIRKVTAILGAGIAAGCSGWTGPNGPDLTLENNIFTVTDFQVQRQSRLSIEGAGIQQLNYTLADSASLTVNGIANHYLNHH
jgi:hypothetical protein